MVAGGAIDGVCLGDDTIAALVEGGLGDGVAGAARAHLATCTACRRLVAAAVDAGAGPGPTAAGSGSGSGTLRGVPSGSFGPGSVVAGRYRIERPLGEGGMGRVFAARQIGLERPVAVKILRPELAGDALALARFQREARLV